MSKRRLVITAVLAGESQSEVARRYGVSQPWISRLLARYKVEGEAAFEPRSRRPHTSPNAVPPATVDLVVRVRKQLAEQGLDAGPDTICWHLAHHHRLSVSRATVARLLARQGLVVPQPKKRPKSSYLRFEAAQPNETWQSDFTHYRLAGPGPRGGPRGDTRGGARAATGQEGVDVEVISWLDDHSRFALSVTAHPRVTGPIVVATFRAAVARHGIPASTLTDNGMVFTTRLSGGSLHGTGGRNGFEHELRRLVVVQKNSRPGHPTTCGKVERFQQTLKNWLRAQPIQPDTIAGLQTLLDAFVETYNQHRPHRSLPHQATPAAAYTARPKVDPGSLGGTREHDNHHRVRTDRVDTGGKVTLRHGGTLYSIGVGRTHARTRVLLLVEDLQIRIINAVTGELLRELTLDPAKRYQGTGRPPGPCPVPGLMEALIPREDESHGSTEEVSRGASGAGDQDGGRSAA